MKIQFKKAIKEKNYDFINTRLISQNRRFKSIKDEKDEINRTTIINKTFNQNNQNNKNNIRYIKIFTMYKIISLLLISNLFKLYCQIEIISNDSLVTLKVSGNGEQKIFNSGTEPNEIFMDNEKPSSLKYIHSSKTNNITLKWTNINIIDCNAMFEGCDSIVEMNFTLFNATKCHYFRDMFKDCKSLISLDLSGFITSSLLNSTSNMFMNCYSLISLNLSTFDTSENINFGHMFCNCSSLTSIDFSNFKTEKVQYLDNMFKGCKNLTSLNLSNFNTSNLIKMDNMFDGCESLKILDFSNLDITNISNIENIDNIFQNCNNLEFINIENLKSNINLENNFFKGTPTNLTVCTNNNKKELFNNILENNNNCIILITCGGNLSEYKLNTENECLTYDCTKTKYKYEFQYKCYNECPDNSEKRLNIEELKELTPNGEYFCKPICNESFPLELITTQKCANNCDINNILEELCILNYLDKGNSFIYDTLLTNIEDYFTSFDYNTSEIENGIDDIMKYKNMNVTLTSTINQKNNENNNVSTIYLGDCETKLKIAYNISLNETLFIKKIDVLEDGMLIPKIEYDVYYKLNRTNLVKLNLSYCNNSKIYISYPVKITENLDIYNSSSGYYNDICITISRSGADITLRDRRTEFTDNNKTICQENCLLSDYNYTIYKAKCSCDVKKSSSKFENMKIDKTKLYENFIDIKNIANINILVCYKVLFSKIGLIKNSGSYSIIGIVIIHFFIIIFFYSKNLYSQIQNIINIISFSLNNCKFLKIPIREEKVEEEIINVDKEKIYRKKIEKKSKNKKHIKSIEKLKKDYIENPPIKKKRKHRTKNNIENDKELKYQNEETNGTSKKYTLYKNGLNSTNMENIVKQIKKIIPYNDEELNNLDYKLALKYDTRKYCQYYLSLLKTKHILIFTFCNNNDYNLKIIKIDLFLFNFAISYMVNALFFDDDTMHKIYKNKGAFDILDQLPQVVYSFLISSFFSFILELLALTEGVILELKKIKNKIEFNQRILKFNSTIKIKFLIYFIISSIFLLFFWYYLSMFCAIYVNTQFHLIKDTVLSFILSFIEPLGIYLIPGLFRIPSLSKKYNNRYILYKLSQILQIILI